MATRGWIFGLTGLLLGSTAPTGLLAQEGADAPGENGGAGPVMMDAVSVTATRNPIRAFEFPGMVSVIGRERIENRQASTPDDILSFVPNVEFTGGPRRSGEAPSIRGFSGADIVITLDGARQNFQSAHDGRVFVDPSLLREVEVLRGPASSLYGNGGNGGVIEFRTARAGDFLAPDERMGARVSGGFQSANDEAVGTATVYGRPSGNLDLIGSVTTRNSGDIRLGDGSELDRSDDEIVSGLAKAEWEIAPHHSLEASFVAFRNDAEEPNNGQGLGDENLVDKDIRSDTVRATYRYRNPNDDLIDLDATAYYTVSEADELRLDDLGNGPAGELLRRDVDTYGFRLDNRSRATLTETADVTFTYGAEGFRDEQTGAAGDGPRDGVPSAEAEFIGGFAQAELRLSEPFGVIPGDVLLIPGARFDHFSSSSDVSDRSPSDNRVSPRIGVSYLPTEWSMLFASYSEAFRAPTINELFQEGVHFRIPVGTGIVNRFVTNADLDPQTTRTVEFGGGLDIPDVLTRGDRAHVKVSHFRLRGDDFIDIEVDQPEPFAECNPFIPGTCDGTTRAFNVADAELHGTEVEAGYENRRLRLDLGLSTIDGENRDTGEKLGVLTPLQVMLDSAVKLPEVDSLVGWRVLAADTFDKVDDPAERRSGYAVHDFYAAWTPKSGPLEGLRIDLGIDNAFDKAFSRVFTGALEQGRNFKVLASYSVNW